MTIRAKERLSPVWMRYGELEVERGEGSWLIDRQGNRWLDFTSGIAVVSTGHAHPQVVRAVQEQAAKLLHGQANLVYHRPLLELVEALAQVMPHPSLDTFFFSNSGAEAVEAAIKLAKRATGRPNLIAFQGGFHGRTYGALSLTTSKTLYRAGYEPLLGGIYFAPYPYPYRMGMEPKACGRLCLEQLEAMLVTQVDPPTVAAMLVEPVLGEGGYVVPPPNFLPGLRALCDQHGILLILDEVQTGFGRTAKMFAAEYTGVRPDILIMAKGIASGLPLSSIAAPRALMERWEPGSHGGTYGGNALACAAALATLRVLREERLLENAAERGAELTAGLEELQGRYASIGEVRGLGLMVAAEFVGPDRQPNKALAKEIIHQAMERRLLLLSCGTLDNVIRFIPPLVVKGEEIERALTILEASLVAAIPK